MLHRVGDPEATMPLGYGMHAPHTCRTRTVRGRRLMVETQQLEAAIWSISEGRGSDDELAILRADERKSLTLLDRLIFDAEEDLESVRNLKGEERDQVVADFTDTLHGLQSTAARLRPPPAAPVLDLSHADEHLGLTSEPWEPEEVLLQASWSDGQVVVWAGGRGSPPDTNDALATRLEAIGGPSVGWQLHAGVPLPGGLRAEAVAIPMKDALGWLVAIGGGHTTAGLGASVQWLGRAALEGVRLAARGSAVPALRLGRMDGGSVDAAVHWVPALLDAAVVNALASAMPGAVVAVGGGNGRATATSVITAAVEAIFAESIERIELPAAPAHARTPLDFDNTVIAHLGGSTFRGNAGLATATSRRLEQWSRSITDASRPKLVVQLDPPTPGGVWLVSVFAPSGKGPLTPIDAVLRTDSGRRIIGGEWQRLGRMFPAVDRVGASRRGQVAISQDEAWEFMTLR